MYMISSGVLQPTSQVKNSVCAIQQIDVRVFRLFPLNKSLFSE
jgi:hypothetical protein